MKKMKVLVFAVLMLVLSSAVVFAVTNTANLGVNISVINQCTVTGGTLNFPQYASGQPENVDGSFDIKVKCDSGVGYGVTLDDGAHFFSTSRRMNDSGSGYINYGLFTDAGHGNPWAGATNSPGTGTNGDDTHTVYGRVLGNQTAPAGSYSDTVVVTVTY